MTSVLLVAVGAVVGETVRALIVFHQKTLAHWWDEELGATYDADDPTPVLADATVTRMVQSGDFYTVFQPIYALDDGRLIGVEALTRFDSEPPIPPNVWFGRAADLGFGVALEVSAVERALASAKGLTEGVVVSVNVSSPTMLSDELVALVRRTQRRVLLELTELEPIADYAAMRAAIARLRAAGARVAIDNVGASLTSLRHISRLAPDVIKLDAVLTAEGRGDPLTHALTVRLLRYGRDSGALLIAGGIEDVEDLAYWRERGADAAQGYLLGRPGPLSFVETFTFPSSMSPSGRKSGATRERGDVARRRNKGDGGVSLSQLDDTIRWGSDGPPPIR